MKLYEYCIEGNTKMFIYTVENNMLDIHENNEWLFILACKLGHIEIVIYLLNISQNYSGRKIDIHSRYEDAFVYSCMNGHIKIVKYLINIAENYSGKKINIHIDDDSAFSCALINNRFTIVLYLLKISQNYSNKYIDIQNTEIYDTCKNIGYLLRPNKIFNFCRTIGILPANIINKFLMIQLKNITL